MDTLQLDPGDPGDPGRRPRWSGRTRRVVTTSALGAVLLGCGAGVGVAMTGGASASTSPAQPGATTTATVAKADQASRDVAGRCARLVQRAASSDHGIAAARLRAFCGRPLLRLALVGGEHGQVTFRGKDGPVTDAFERGTVQSDTGSAITVKAADGTTWTWVISSSTVVRRSGTKVQASVLATGETVFVGGTVVNGANDARLIRIATSK